MEKVFIALGSNIGEATEHFQNARAALGKLGNSCVGSSLHLSKPCGYTDQADFTNAVIMMETPLPVFDLLLELQKIEKAEGKVFLHQNGPRTLDLDIIFYGSQVINSTDLEVPHPRATERDFVLLPVLELAPEFLHPVKKQTIIELAEALKERFVYRTEKIEGFGK